MVNLERVYIPVYFSAFSLLLQSHLKEIQVAFISVLSDPDGKKSSAHYIHFGEHYHFICPLFLFFISSELSQDVASKGLGLVYEMGGERDQQELVSTLVETLMTGKR